MKAAKKPIFIGITKGVITPVAIMPMLREPSGRLCITGCARTS